MTRQNVGILIFDGVEVLDFAGPFEVFSRTRLKSGVESRRSDESAPFNVYTVAQAAETVNAIGDLQIIPRYHFEDGAKIAGVIFWLAYFTRTAKDAADN